MFRFGDSQLDFSRWRAWHWVPQSFLRNSLPSLYDLEMHLGHFQVQIWPDLIFRVGGLDIDIVCLPTSTLGCIWGISGLAFGPPPMFTISAEGPLTILKQTNYCVQHTGPSCFTTTHNSVSANHFTLASYPQLLPSPWITELKKLRRPHHQHMYNKPSF